MKREIGPISEGCCELSMRNVQKVFNTVFGKCLIYVIIRYFIGFSVLLITAFKNKNVTIHLRKKKLRKNI